MHAFYNMGLWSLVQSLVTQGGTDSVLYHAANAVEANKAALRLDPEHENARWNLALARKARAVFGRREEADAPAV